MNELTDAKLLGSKIKRHLISKESYYERGLFSAYMYLLLDYVS